jgi:hypothetical protein
MALQVALSACAVCTDRFPTRAADCCARCQRIVCRACSRSRDRSHESVLCTHCAGSVGRTGLRRTALYRRWRRLIEG